LAIIKISEVSRGQEHLKEEKKKIIALLAVLFERI
jgi:hypothetical protein